MYQTMEEIRAQYDGHWVYLIQCREGEYHETIGGVVAIVGKTMREALKGWESGNSDEGINHLMFVGNPPSEVSYLL